MLIGLAIGGVLGEVVNIVVLLTASALLRTVGGIFALLMLPKDDRPPAPMETVSQSDDAELVAVGDQAMDPRA